MTSNPASPAFSALQRAINSSPGFPAFIANVQELLTIQNNPYQSVNAVSAIILRDLSLTTQILKVVNSIFFQQRQVHTVSNAVMVLGFDRLRDLAVGLRLFENFQKSAHLAQLKQLIVHSFLTAIQAQELARHTPHLKAEEIFITALLFNIGELIVAYYLPAKYRKILDLQGKGEAKSAAAQQVLKASMDEVGLAILRDWNLPDSMVKRLSYLHSPGTSGDDPEARLRKMIRSSFDLSTCLLDPQRDPAERRKKEEKVCGALGVNAETLSQSLTASKERLQEMTQVLGLDLPPMEVSEDTGSQDVREPGPEAAAPKSQEPPIPREDKTTGTSVRAADSETGDLKKLRFIYQVVEEINQALVSQAPINQVLLLILEGIFRGIRFDRVIFCLVDPQRAWVKARFGLGDGVDHLLPLIHLPLNADDNAFSLALAERREYLVNPHNHSGDRSLMDDNFWRVSQTHSFLVAPIHVDQLPVGAFFVDRTTPEIPISEEDQQHLRTFRDLTIISLRLCTKGKIF